MTHLMITRPVLKATKFMKESNTASCFVILGVICIFVAGPMGCQEHRQDPPFIVVSSSNDIPIRPGVSPLEARLTPERSYSLCYSKNQEQE
jgi:hypothetical protein